MNDTLKAAGRIGAELGAAKAEVERLRGEIARAVREFDECDAFNAEGRAVELMEELRAALSQQADHVRDTAQMMVPSEILKAIAWGDRDDAAEAIGSLRCLLADPEGEDEIAFPDSPEPTDTYTAVDMATAAAQGFRDGQAAMEPAPAQDELEAPEVVAVLYKSGDVLTAEECGIALEVCEKVETPLMTVAQHNRIVAALTCPAQTEQQPVSWQFYQDGKWWNGDDRIKDHRKNTEAAGIPVRDLYAAPIAQTEQQPGKVMVSADPLRKVLNAFVNAPYQIRELQVTREPVSLFADNPINILIAEYNAAHGDK